MLIVRDTPAPDIPSYLAHMSAANVMIKQWTLGILLWDPPHRKDELDGSSYILPMGSNDSFAVEFNVRLGDRKMQRNLQKNDIEREWVQHFERQYGKDSVSQHGDAFLLPLKDAF